jgi:hypothetical protein
MSASQRRAVARERLGQRGVVRPEVQVRRQDVALVRAVVGALADTDRAASARETLREHFAPQSSVDLKALLATAPLEGIDLEREDDTGRPVEL